MKIHAFDRRNALLAMLLLNTLILMDRQVITVLAEAIKDDLQFSDADIGFFYGTALSVFFAIFNLPLGRLADLWSRKTLLASCLAAWSAVIFLTGTARSFVSFASYRIGVGVGEGAAAPTSMSLISDYFPPRQRSSAMAVFGAGLPLGAGLGVLFGGFVLDTWNAAFHDPTLAPLGLKGWQIAYFCIAVPGPFLALAILQLKEPPRGVSDGIVHDAHPHPFREAWWSLKSVLPIVSWSNMLRLKGGSRMVRTNLVIGILTALVALALIELTGSVAQWSALGFGVWCVASWIQTLVVRDPPTFAMIIKCRALLFSNIGLAGFVFLSAGVGAWITPLLMRTHNASASEVGMMVGILIMSFGFGGAILGGLLADYLERHTPKARMYLIFGSLLITALSVLMIAFATTLTNSYIFAAFFFLGSHAWYGIGPSIANGLVMPRMRGVSSAFYLIVISFLGWALGPYFIGHVSDVIAASGVDYGESLRQGILWSLLSLMPTTAALAVAYRNFDRDSTDVMSRARALGEPV
ncbi:MAG: MFS transporter [Gammaproteobacteria bacterium]|nr:MFS transporter [Gammaproteobacteria bacterium]